MDDNKIYIPVNIQTEQMIFQGYSVKELGKTLVFSLILCAVWAIIYIFTQSTIQLMFECMVSVVVGVFIFVRDTTNQNIVNYIMYIINYFVTQRSYRYNNKIEGEEMYFVRKYKEYLISEKGE